MKKTKIVTSLLAVLLIFCSLFTLVGCAEYDWRQEGDFEIGYCEKINDAFLGEYFWNGHLGEDMDIVLPNTYNGAPVTALGGYCGLGVPTHFVIHFMGTDDFDRELYGDDDTSSAHGFYCDYKANTEDEVYTNTKKQLERYYDITKGFEIKDIVFNLHIGSNLQQIVEIRKNEMKQIEFNTNEENEVLTVYAFSFFITVDENNKYFYSDDLGRMYYKENDKLVDYFLYHNRDSFPEQGEDADPNKIPERPEDTNLEFWIAQDVSEVDFSEYEMAVSMMSGYSYLGKGYYSDINSTKGVVIYVVNKYPDNSDGKDCVTSILINDADVTLYGINCDSTFEQFDKAMKSKGYEVKISNPQQNQTVHTASLGKVYITLSVTAYTEQPEQTHYSKMLVIGLQ